MTDPDHFDRHRSEELDLEALAGVGEIEEFLFEPPPVGPSIPLPSDEAVPPAPSLGAAAPALTAAEAPAKLGFRLRGGLFEGLRARLRAARAPEAADAPGADDPFATLLSPLSARELEELRREVEADTIMYSKVTRAREREGTSVRGGFSLGMLAAAAAFPIWRRLFDGLTDQDVPGWVTDAAGEHASYGEIAWFSLGALVPVAFLLVAAAAGAHLLRGLLRRSLVSFIAGLAVASCALVSLAAADRAQIVAALVAAGSGLVLSGLARIVSGAKGRVHGSPRA